VRTTSSAALRTVIVTSASFVRQYPAVTASSWPSPSGENERVGSPGGRVTRRATVTGLAGALHPWYAPNWSYHQTDVPSDVTFGAHVETSALPVQVPFPWSVP